MISADVGADGGEVEVEVEVEEGCLAGVEEVEKRKATH